MFNILVILSSIAVLPSFSYGFQTSKLLQRSLCGKTVHIAVAFPLRARDSKPKTPRLAGGGFGSKPSTPASQGASIGTVRRLMPGNVKLSPTNAVPSTIMRPDYAVDGKPKATKKGMPWDIIPQTPEDIARMRVAGRIAREVLDAAVRAVQPGITTDFIDQLVHKETIARNSYPSPLNYHGFPKSCCTSINEVICHGIPDNTELLAGDILNIDVTVFHDGVHGDCSETVFVGPKEAVPEPVRDLVQTTFTAWQAAIAHCRPGVKYSELGGIIEDIIAAKGYSTVEIFCGHGVGRLFHTYPNVLHYRNNDRTGVMAAGHTFTIEPMICLGTNQVLTWPDKWTAVTKDGLPSAQFEHTLLITDTGVEELTAKLPTSPKYSWEL